MRSLTLTPAELAALQSSPALLVEAINDTLEQTRFLADHYQVLTGQSLGLTLPANVPEPGAIGDPGGGPAYGANGLTAPRMDGAVRCKAWDDAIAAALASFDPVIKAWAEENAPRPWLFIQDTLKLHTITTEQKRTIGSNCGNARFLNGLLGGTRKGWSWFAFKVAIDGDGVGRFGEQIPDAIAVNDDLVNLAGEVQSRGWWAADMPELADRSLLHFVKTSGKAVLLALKR